MDIKEEDILGSAISDHWYYVSKGRALLKLLGRTSVDEVLDVGAGSGVFSRLLLDAGLARRATCVDPAYPADRTETHNGRTINFIRTAQPRDYGLTLMMDVIEHVDDDAGLIRSYAGSGDVLITVPAFPMLWSGHDVFLEHRRRYTVRTLHEAVHRAGLTPVKSSYFFSPLFPVIAAIRLAKRGTVEPKSDLAIYPRWLNKALTAIHDVERTLLFPSNRFFGLTIFCLCRR